MVLEREVYDSLPIVRSLYLGGDLIELAILFLLLSIIAAVVGARRVAGVSMTLAKWLVIIFAVLAIVPFVL